MLLLSSVTFFIVFFFKQKTAYEMRISDWSSDVCSSDLKGYAAPAHLRALREHGPCPLHRRSFAPVAQAELPFGNEGQPPKSLPGEGRGPVATGPVLDPGLRRGGEQETVLAFKRSEEHTSELQSLMRISYAVSFLKQNNRHNNC